VVGDRGPAGGAGGVRRGALRRVAALHHDDDLLRLWQHPDGTSVRSLRYSRSRRLLGSSLQALALVFFLPFDGLFSLYILSALFGLAQGGIVPAYAVIIREFFPAEEAGVRVGTVLMATVFGMALGGWMSGVIFDLTGSYQAAFLNGILWNLLNVGIAVGLLRRPGMPVAQAWP
jgi:MFS family permease